MQIPAPLTPDELQPLVRQERGLRRFYAIAIPLVIGCGAAAFAWSDIAWLRRAMLIAVIAAVFAATALQMRLRCPRCNARLRTTMLLAMPRRCRYCGVALSEAGG